MASKESIELVKELHLADTITHFRKKKGLSKFDLSCEADVSYGYIQSIEQGKQFPSLFVLCKIAEALDVEPWELLAEYNWRKEVWKSEVGVN